MSDSAASSAAPAAAPAPAAAAPAAAAPAADATTLLTAPDPAAAPAAAPAPAADDGKQGEGEAKPDDKKPDEADAHAPEAYEDFKLEGEAKLDDEFLGAFKPLAKQLDLPQGKAQQLAQMAATESTRLATKFVTDLRAQVDANSQAWETAVKADPELGGDKHPEVMATAKKALTTFGSPELAQFLNESRLGNNPHLVRLLYRAGKHISQDNVPPGRAAAPSKADADVFYAKPITGT